MEKVNAANDAKQPDAAKPDFEILNQYTKDLSFEAPGSPRVFFEKLDAAPKVDMGLEVKSAKLADELFEIALALKVSSKVGDKALFVIDLTYAAVAAIHVSGEDDIKRIVTKIVPAHIFPYIRSLVSDITGASGFAPFILNPIDFDKVVLK
ncbi:MAG: protein-export chaperone SecB [Rickettsiales bacterium]|jgi:preprotein translocase subunit SecB|nr:protein-export chaperone SecB [Rickettsiales bacterium]